GLTALSAEFTIGEGELMAHDVPLGCAPDEYDDLISGTCSHLPCVKPYSSDDEYLLVFSCLLRVSSDPETTNKMNSQRVYIELHWSFTISDIV
ncbi:hypothetical protein, partial [Escherichia coli]|uniref:hypothetical protein n=1 Tax=Escherichia coli TaxID=562 RepID=UPI001BC847E8